MAAPLRRRDDASSRRLRHSIVLILIVITIVCVSIWKRDEIIPEEDDDTQRSSSSTTQAQQNTPRRIMSNIRSAPDRKAIVTSVKENKQVMEDLCRALGSLSRLHDDNAAPVLVFAEKPPLQDTYKSYLKRCTPRQLQFQSEPSNGKMFWMYQIFALDSLSDYDTVMRLDSGACWQEEPDLMYLPGLPNTTIAYHALTDQKINENACGSLVDFAKHYIVQNHVIVQSPHLWYEIDTLWRERRKCLAYQTNFEVVRLDLMRQENVQLWLNTAIEKDPTWNEELLRSFTVAMFAPAVIPPSKAYPKGYTFSIRRPGLSCRNLPGEALDVSA